jgi:hypothetical protein
MVIILKGWSGVELAGVHGRQDIPKTAMRQWPTSKCKKMFHIRESGHHMTSLDRQITRAAKFRIGKVRQRINRLPDVCHAIFVERWKDKKYEINVCGRKANVKEIGQVTTKTLIKHSRA